MNEIMNVENKKEEVQVLPDYEILNPDIPMTNKISVAINVAKTLAPLLKEQGLSVKGLNKKKPEAEYVVVEGWEVLGTMLGIVPVTKIIETITNPKNGAIVGYKARATLYRNPIIKNDEIVGGVIIARAEAQADSSGFQKEKFAMASMAQTRALGKAYRMGLSWIIKMAGFEATFAEDMPKFDNSQTKNSQTKNDKVIEAETTIAKPNNFNSLLSECEKQNKPSRKGVLTSIVKKGNYENKHELLNYIKSLPNTEIKKEED